MRRTPLPPQILRLARAQAGLVSTRQCDAAGIGPTVRRGLVARREWTRPGRGVYDTTPGPRSVDDGRRAAAWTALLAFGPDAVAVGACALVMHRVAGLPSRITPEVAMPGADRRRTRDQIVCRHFDTDLRTVLVAGRRVVALDLALAQAVPELSRAHGLAVLDDVLHRGLLDRSGLDRVHDLARGRRGVASRHELWAFADARSESPLESFARLDCIDAGVPPDVLQLPVLDLAGRVRARGDMAWRLPHGRWLVAEVDGREVHGLPDAVYADRSRQNALVGTGRIDVLRFTSHDLGRIGTTVRGVLARARTGDPVPPIRSSWWFDGP
ncbi:hypothetical protein CLV28_0438 [Sediminihabitans luteus]|uniref:Uncharacterized protein n=1 Tax=Sediminihabitans luteus TaxID=1138585 RepID=A0A2M9CZ58_9CELL|nr:type IV toxin-antitoxin system AbiEi family antitoxin domain-containing protein [Sediminihabitans luteus]PJJ77224.1 hypothetical protein CLV28_0438 [Sediminihabitans luteus]GII98672.1 hypothetical protein Slu03_10500 [Sediminihabitans luteus]